jgi:hypothetical protein
VPAKPKEMAGGLQGVGGVQPGSINQSRLGKL